MAVHAPDYRRPMVVVVAYHNTDDLRRCLTALGGWGDLTVVDNGGDDAVAEIVQTVGGRYVRPAGNLGFAAAVNLALANRLKGQHVLLLNPDAFLRPDDAAELVRQLEADPSCAAVAPRLLELDGLPQPTAWPVPSPREVWVDALGLRRWFSPRRRFLVGAALLLNAAALDEIGNLDERYFLYAEECDWQVRAQLRGWRLLQAENVCVTHIGGASSQNSERREILFHRSAEAFGRKWYGRRGWAMMRAASVTGAVLRLAVAAAGPARGEHARRLRIYLRGTG